MPRLSIFAVCEKVIIDDSGMASLICLFSRIDSASQSLGAEIPSDAVAAKEWAVFSSWDWEDGDEEKEFEELVEVRFPDGKVFSENRVKFSMQKDRKQQIKMPFLGIPIGQDGNCIVRLWLKQGDILVAEAPPIYITIRHRPSPKQPS